MDILFKREQHQKNFGGATFRLWAKAEFTDDELALVDRYGFRSALILDADDTDLRRIAGGIGIAAAIAAFIALVIVFRDTFLLFDYLIAMGLSLLIGIGAGYWWFNEKRERLFMDDLLFGRRFKCRSVIDLAKKEAEIENVCGVLRQVLETAKHWDGVETIPIPVLPHNEAKEVVLGIR